jgi:sugar lactone lactonase YvrE
MSARLDRPRRLGVVSAAAIAVAALSGLGVSAPAHADGALRAPSPDARHQSLSSSVQAQQVSADYAAPVLGTVVVADCPNGAVLAVAPDGTVSTLASGYSCPAGVAVDNDGNVYFATYSSDTTAYKISTDGTVSTIGSGLQLALGVEVDPAGNVFVADSGNSRVVEIAPDGTQTTVPFTGLSRPYGVSVDSDGNVYTTEPDLGTVIKLTPDGTQTQVGSSYGYPSGVATETDGNVLVTDDDNNRVQRIAPDNSESTLPFTALSQPADVAVDGAGNVFAVNYAVPGVYEVAPDGTEHTVSSSVGGYGIAVMTRTPQSVDFTTDVPGNAVPGDTYDVAVTGGDSGNPVTLSADPASARICVVTDNGDGTASVDLNRVGDCVIDADQAGTDVYAPGHATQTVAIRHRQWISFTSTPQRPQVGTSYTVTATGGGSGNPVTFTLADASEAGCSVTTEGQVTFVHATSCTIEADQTGDGEYVSAAPVFQEIAVNRGNQDVLFTSTRSQAKVGHTYRPTAVGGATGNRIRFSATGACSARHSVITFTNAGRCYVFANQNGSADYRPGKAHQTILVVKP